MQSSSSADKALSRLHGLHWLCCLEQFTHTAYTWALPYRCLRRLNLHWSLTLEHNKLMQNSSHMIRSGYFNTRYHTCVSKVITGNETMTDSKMETWRKKFLLLILWNKQNRTVWSQGTSRSSSRPNCYRIRESPKRSKSTYVNTCKQRAAMPCICWGK